MRATFQTAPLNPARGSWEVV